MTRNDLAAQIESNNYRQMALNAKRWNMSIAELVRVRIAAATDFGRDAAEDTDAPIVY